jgi:hypothetical protein
VLILLANTGFKEFAGAIEGENSWQDNLGFRCDSCSNGRLDDLDMRNREESIAREDWRKLFISVS